MNRSIWSVLVITMTILLVVTATANAAPGNGKGNAWGRVARDMQVEKAPGSIAALVHQLKADSAVTEPPIVDEAEEEGDTDHVAVVVTVINVSEHTDDETGETTYNVTVRLPAEGDEEPVDLEIEVDAELFAQLDGVEELELDVDEDGNYALRLLTTEDDPEAVEDDETEQ